jgi:hypothetical protein
MNSLTKLHLKMMNNLDYLIPKANFNDLILMHMKNVSDIFQCLIK